jgi:hypothetical protein
MHSNSVARAITNHSKILYQLCFTQIIHNLNYPHLLATQHDTILCPSQLYLISFHYQFCATQLNEKQLFSTSYKPNGGFSTLKSTLPNFYQL